MTYFRCQTFKFLLGYEVISLAPFSSLQAPGHCSCVPEMFSIMIYVQPFWYREPSFTSTADCLREVYKTSRCDFFCKIWKPHFWIVYILCWFTMVVSERIYRPYENSWTVRWMLWCVDSNLSHLRTCRDGWRLLFVALALPTECPSMPTIHRLCC